MTEIDTVVDGPSLRAWLEDLPRNSEEERAHVREVVILLMSRAAGRQLPAYWQALHAIDLDSTFQILRASLLPRVVSQRLSPPLRENVAAAARGVDAVSGSGAKSASDYAQVMTSVSGGSHAAIDPFEGSAS